MSRVKYLIPIVVFFSCTHLSTHQHDIPLGPSEEEPLHLSSIQAQNINLSFEKFQKRNIRGYLKLSGRVELPPNGKMISSSIIPGIIKSVHIWAGDQVYTGQKLFTIENLELINWQREIEEQSAELLFLQNELTRQQTLHKDGISPLKTIEALQRDIVLAGSRIKAAETKLKAVGIFFKPGEAYKSEYQIYAGSKGIVQHLLSSKGQYIGSETPLAEIISNEHLHLHLLATGSQVNNLKKGIIMNFFVQSRPGKIHSARIRWVNPMVNESSNSYDIHADILDDFRELSAGEYVEARIPENEQQNFSLSMDALTEDMGLNYIFVKTEEKENGTIYFEKKQVRQGQNEMGFVEIFPIDSLDYDAEVVSSGAFMLMAESKKGLEGAGHEH